MDHIEEKLLLAVMEKSRQEAREEINNLIEREIKKMDMIARTWQLKNHLDHLREYKVCEKKLKTYNDILDDLNLCCLDNIPKHLPKTIIHYDNYKCITNNMPADISRQ